jgi:hypothetical protein
LRRFAATLAAGATSLALLALNLVPRRSFIVTDEGPWPESWRLQFGWPSTAFTEFGYDPTIRMTYWTYEGLAANALVASAAVTLAVLFTFAVRRPARLRHEWTSAVRLGKPGERTS